MTPVTPWAKIAGVLFAVLIATMLVLAIGGVAVNIWNADKAAKSAIAEARGGQAVAEGGAAAAVDAVAITDAGRARDDRTIIIQRENAHDLQSAPGASTLVDPELLHRLARGMCRYASTAADPACAELREADSAVLP